MNKGVLHGVRVLETVCGLAGPYSSMFLGDQGADVVKLEPAGGDPYRSDPGFQTVNRNKRSVQVGDDDSIVDMLASKADIVIVPDVETADRFRQLNSSVVAVIVSDWGTDPRVPEPYASVSNPSPSLVHAATGIAWNQQSYAEVPVDVVVPIVHYATGLLASIAAVTGLYARARHTVCPQYEVSLVAGAAAIQLGESYPAGMAQQRPGDSSLGSKGRVACYRLVEAKDNQWLFLACGTAKFYKRMLDVIGRPELIDDPDLAQPPWGLMLDPAIERLTPILDEVFASRDRDEWLELLAAADVPAQPVLTRDEFLTSSIVASNQMTVSVQHDQLGTVEMMGIPFTIQAAPGAVRTPAPEPGQHTTEAVTDWAAIPPPTAPTRPKLGSSTTDDTMALGGGSHRPLAGLKVVDLASFIAGPLAARHLAMLGAEVIKVEPPGGDPFRAIGPMFISWNQGKQSIELDLTTDTDRETLHRLIKTADVVVENFRPGVGARLGVDIDTLRAINPQLVFLSSPGFGLDESMADKPAFDPLVQALGGFMAAQGGMDNGQGFEPVFLSVPIHDVSTPMVATLGVVLALYHRHQTGKGQTVRTSLVQSTMVSQAAEYTRFSGRPPTASGGFDFGGPDEQHSWHETVDGLVWRDGDQQLPVCQVGLTADPLADLNNLTVQTDHGEYGPTVTFGSLIGGIGPAPSPSPLLNQHHDSIISNLEET